MADAFISYKTERRNAAQHLSRILELNGFSVWFDYGLLSGTDFGPQIERELRAAKAVIVLWCTLSHDSKWVLEEAHLAERLGTLTPVWLEPVELPLGFGRADTIDLSHWDGSPRSPALDRLLNEVGRRVGRDPAPSYRGLQHYEETWRSFGAPPLSRFALVDPIDEEARAFGMRPSLDPPAGAEGRTRATIHRPAGASPPAAAAPPVAPRRLGRGAVLAGAVAAAVAVVAVIGGAALWYGTATPPPQASLAPPPAAVAAAPPTAVAAAPPPAPSSPSEPAPPAADQVINAPCASFLRSNSGWSVTLSFLDPVTAIAWRIGDTGEFRETGALEALDVRTRRRIANPGFELDPDQPATTLEIRAVDLQGRTAGPFPIAFDPAAELMRGDRRTLEMTAGAWLSFREFNGLLLYYTHLMSYRCAIREMRIGIDSTVPNQVVSLGECDPKHPYDIPQKAQPYLKLPPATKMVSVELTYRDGSVSETKTYRR
ncbi:MAG TPA: toll/interleukin-1 receptor domain-containing protein [Stellaceae bacterium]|nr:toll/interleukin-1 receptor domain-containing protein [Stellaceae bacterium]